MRRGVRAGRKGRAQERQTREETTLMDGTSKKSTEGMMIRLYRAKESQLKDSEEEEKRERADPASSRPSSHPHSTAAAPSPSSLPAGPST